MNIREISKPVTAKSLNESLARKFGAKINIDAFTLEQLQDARNRIRTKLSQVETNESFDAVHKNEGYQKSKLFLDVLNAAISEREDISEANDCDKSCPKSCPDCGGTGDPEKFKAMKEGKKAKPDFLDMDKDGNKKEPMKKAIADKKKKKVGESVVTEGAEDQAELVMAAKDMVDRLTSWMEDTAEMQSESMLELADAIRDEMGNEKSEAFVASVKPALEALYQAMETTRGALTSGVGMLTGEEAPMDDMPGEEAPMEPPVDTEVPAPEEGAAEDDFAAADAAMGGEDEAGRAKRESVERKVSKKKVAETSRRLASLLSKKK